MKGEITAKSQKGKGAEFTVTLPIEQLAEKAEHLPTEEHKARSYTASERKLEVVLPIPLNEEQADLPLALIIEDNADVVNYLASCLEADYRIEIARDGKAGIEQAFELSPDIIISDVMMPEKDGFEVCDTLKNDMRTSHIPIILLTAKADVASRLAGLRRGADAYLPKPFHEEELLIRMAKLLELRDRLRQRYADPGYLTGKQPVEITEEESPLEDEFIMKLREIIMEHLSDSDLDVRKLCKEMGMSRASLHNKLKALTGKSTTEFIRFIRLSRASEMLISTDLQASEVGYETGFSNPSYFHRMFKGMYEMSPLAYREKYRHT